MEKTNNSAAPITLYLLNEEFSICKVSDYNKVDLTRPFCFVEKTDEENSLICETDAVPDNTTDREDGWKAFRIMGTLDVSLVGILAKISALLAKAEIGIFAISTYNTDYIQCCAARRSYSMAVVWAVIWPIGSSKVPLTTRI